MVDIEPCFSCGGEQVSDEYRRNDGHRYGCVCGASGPFCRTREQALAAWNRVAGQRWRPIGEIKSPNHGWLIVTDGKKVMPGYPGWTDYDPSRIAFFTARGQYSLFNEATHWRPLPNPPEPAPIETSGYVEIIGKEPLA